MHGRVTTGHDLPKLSNWLRAGWDLGVLSVYLSNECVGASYAVAIVRELLHWSERQSLNSSTRSDLAVLRDKLTGRKAMKDSEHSALTLQLERITEQITTQAAEGAQHLLVARVCELDVTKLREGARPFVPDSSCWEALSDSQKADLDEAALAVLAGCPTAAAMLSLRAVESALRDRLSATHVEIAQRSGWGRLLDLLRQDQPSERTGFAAKELIDLLAWLKDIRDSVAHPQKRISQERAESIFLNITNDALPALTDKRRSTKEEGSQRQEPSGRAQCDRTDDF